MAVWHVADDGMDWGSKDRWKCNRWRGYLDPYPFMSFIISQKTELVGKFDDLELACSKYGGSFQIKVIIANKQP
jgi:hypothetical protein